MRRQEASGVWSGPASARFSGRDLLADRRLGAAKPVGRPIERPLIGDGDHGGKVPEFNGAHG
jgi:hypothetical protein